MPQTFLSYDKTDILSLLGKVKIFNFRVGDYQKHIFDAPDHYTIFLTNGTIFFTPDELHANKNEQLDFEMMVNITGRFELRNEK